MIDPDEPKIGSTSQPRAYFKFLTRTLSTASLPRLRMYVQYCVNLLEYIFVPVSLYCTREKNTFGCLHRYINVSVVVVVVTILNLTRDP